MKRVVINYTALDKKMSLARALLFFIFACPLGAKDIAVLIDISGSMGNYGAWQQDAKQLTSSILSGNPAVAGWLREGNESTAAGSALTDDQVIAPAPAGFSPPDGSDHVGLVATFAP